MFDLNLRLLLSTVAKRQGRRSVLWMASQAVFLASGVGVQQANVVPPIAPPAAAITLPPPPAHPRSAVTALAYSPDGKQLAVGVYGEVVLYDTTTWQVATVYRHVEDGVRSLAYAPDGKMLAIGCGLPGQHGQTLIWNLDAAAEPQKYAGEGDTVEALSFRGDGKALLCGANDNTARYYPAWPVPTPTKLDEHNGRVTAVAFSPRADFVFLTGGMDRIVKVWDPKTVHTVVNFDQSEGGITGLVFLPNGSQFVGASLDGKLYWWGINFDREKGNYSGYLFRNQSAHDGGVFALAGSANGKRLVSCGADNQVVVWSIDGGRVQTFKDAIQPCYAVTLSQDGKTAVAGGKDGLLYLWDVDGNKLVNILVPPPLPVPPTPPAHVAHAAVKTSARSKSARRTSGKSE